MESENKKIYYHLPGLFEFYEFYKVFLPLFYKHKEYFYNFCEIGSIYGSLKDCKWNGGRISTAYVNPKEVLKLVNGYGISARLTFSNSLLKEEHLLDKRCNELCQLFSNSTGVKNGVIIHSDLLKDYLKSNYPNLYLVSSTTKVLTGFSALQEEIDKEDFDYVVPDFRLNKAKDKLMQLTQTQKDKVEFLCNECCYFGCQNRKACYENVSKQVLDENQPDFLCQAPEGNLGYRFSKAMENPGFIGINDIKDWYMPNGFTNFKIEGRSLGNALLLEFLLHYLTKPEYQLKVREEIYLENTLDLF